MKLYLILALVIVVLLIWLRTRLRRRGVQRSRFAELLMFGLVLAGLIGLIVLAGRLF